VCFDICVWTVSYLWRFIVSFSRCTGHMPCHRNRCWYGGVISIYDKQANWTPKQVCCGWQCVVRLPLSEEKHMKLAFPENWTFRLVMCTALVHDTLDYRKMCVCVCARALARWVQGTSQAVTKLAWDSVSCVWHVSADQGEHFLQSIVTGDEMWANHMTA
jgi:hypothetical protein